MDLQILSGIICSTSKAMCCMEAIPFVVTVDNLGAQWPSTAAARQSTPPSRQHPETLE